MPKSSDKASKQKLTQSSSVQDQIRKASSHNKPLPLSYSVLIGKKGIYKGIYQGLCRDYTLLATRKLSASYPKS